jgi:hypothetical protein
MIVMSELNKKKIWLIYFGNQIIFSTKNKVQCKWVLGIKGFQFSECAQNEKVINLIQLLVVSRLTNSYNKYA